MMKRLMTSLITATLLVGVIPATAHADTSRSRGISSMPSSAYRGKFYDPRYERVRKCIVYRESRGKYGVVNRSSGAAGAYQLMPPLRRYAAQKMGSSWLGGIPANQWSRYNQDRAFYAIVHYQGLKHWRGGNMRGF
jgi:hypothetical protein